MQKRSEQGENVTVLPDATRDEMLEAAGMTTGHRWEDRYVSDVPPDRAEEEQDGYIKQNKAHGRGFVWSGA